MLYCSDGVVVEGMIFWLLNYFFGEFRVESVWYSKDIEKMKDLR